MKQLKIQVAIDEITNKMLTASHFVGYRKDVLSDQLEILGILENLAALQREKLKTFYNEEK